MTSFAARLRADDPARTCRRGLWLTFLSPFGLADTDAAALRAGLKPMFEPPAPD